MKKSKKIMSYSEQVKAETLLGVLWIITGIASCFQNLIALIMVVIALIVLICWVIKMHTVKRENADEMAKQNIYRAKSFAMHVMRIISGCAVIASIIFLKDVEVSVGLSKIIPAVSFICMGMNDILVGIAFRKYEEA